MKKLIFTILIVFILTGCGNSLGAKKTKKERLKAPKEKIIYSKTVTKKRKIKKNTLLGSSTTTEDVVEEDVVYISYDYISDVIATGSFHFNRDDNYGNTEIIDDNSMRLYVSDKFYKDGEDVYIIEKGATSTIEDYNEWTKITWLEKIFGLTAKADQESYDSSSGDGTVQRNGVIESWSSTVNSSSGTSAAGTGNSGNCPETYYTGGGTKPYIVRGFLPFDTSGLPDDATISSAVLNLYYNSKGVTDNDDQAYAVVVESTQASISSLATSDYGNVGSSAWSNTLRIENMTMSAYNEYTLTDPDNQVSKTGNTKLAVREGHDFENNALGSSDNNYANANFSENGSNIPFLLVTFTSGPTDSCTYGGTGNWIVQESDNCYIGSDVYVNGSMDIVASTSGAINCNAQVSYNNRNQGENEAVTWNLGTNCERINRQ